MTTTLNLKKSNFDQFPFVAVTDALHPCVTGWDKIAEELRRVLGRGRLEKPILVVDCYPGVDEAAVLKEFTARLAPKLVIHAGEAYHPAEKIDQLVAPFLGESDAPRRRPCNLSLVNFFDAEPLWRFRRSIDDLKEGLVLIVGCGASLIAWGHVLVYANLARRAAQQRFHRNETGNLGAHNLTLTPHAKSQRASLVDWRVADRWKRPLIRRWDYVLDTNDPAQPKLADAVDVRSGLRIAVTRPFRLVPAVHTASSAAHGKRPGDVDAMEGPGDGFNCVPEESSLLLRFGDTHFEMPALDLVFYQPRALLGETIHLRFADGFPIRFSFPDPVATGDPRFKVRVPANNVERTEPVATGDGWREEKIGSVEELFIEIRRHWFTKKVPHETNGGINVLALAAGEEAVVESPTEAFAPFVVHYAETFIVPAAVGDYTIRPHGPSVGTECATMKAFLPARARA